MTQREVDHLLVMFTCHSPNIVELVLNHFKKSMGPNELLVDRKTVERKLEELYMTNDTYAQLSGNVWMVLVSASCDGTKFRTGKTGNIGMFEPIIGIEFRKTTKADHN